MSSNYLTADNGVSSGVTGITQSAGNDGTLQIRTTTSGGTATTAVTIDNLQNVGFGCTALIGSGSVSIKVGQSLQWQAAGASTVYGDIYTDSSNNMVFRNGSSPTERGRFDTSGNLLVGATSQTQAGKIFSSFNQSTNQGITLQNTSSSNSAYFVYMLNSAGNAAGSITQTGATSVNYGSGSDYRLKENIQPMTGALAKVNQLNPVTFDWIADKTQGQGFIAHELQVIVPECVYGEKDAVDSEGNLKYQMVDQSKLVGVLTKAIQELAAQVTSLQATVETQATTIATLQNKIGA